MCEVRRKVVCSVCLFTGVGGGTPVSGLMPQPWTGPGEGYSSHRQDQDRGTPQTGPGQGYLFPKQDLERGTPPSKQHQDRGTPSPNRTRTGVTLPQTRLGQGYPSPRPEQDRGTPPPNRTRTGYPSPRLDLSRGTPPPNMARTSRSRQGGHPHPSMEGTPLDGEYSLPHIRTGWGYPLPQEWMALGQVMLQSVRLLRFPAGGLSRSVWNIRPDRSRQEIQAIVVQI